MNRTFFALGGAAVVLLVAVMALRLYGNQLGGVGSQPSPSPTAAPTAPPSATPGPNEDGDLTPGTHVLHPLRPNDSLAVTFTVPEGWSAAFGTLLLPAGDRTYAPPDGMAILFEDVATLNGDPCDWLGTADDVSVGPGVDDLVEALLAQTAYDVSGPVDVTIGGYGGKRVDIVVPTEPFAGQTSDAPECDRGAYRLWSTRQGDEAGIYVQGPADRWHTNILDVDGTRLVIVARDFPGTSPEDRAEMDAIIDSFVIDP